jgi:photosystem II stability/assembly factor-like uncharacterized protein
VLVTSDAGRNWAIVTVKDPPASLFFLNESVGWMVTPKGIYKTVESGRSWKKQHSPKQVPQAGPARLLPDRATRICALRSKISVRDE